MKRAVKGKAIPEARTRDVKQDFSKDQLAAIGAVALAFNDLQADMEALLQVVVRMPGPLFLQICSRIHGLDGKIAIINTVIDDAIIAKKEQDELKSTVGIFADFKINRDAIIHARIWNAALGIGWNSERRAQEFEVLLEANALNIFYDHIVWLQKAFSLIGNLLGSVLSLNALALGDQNRPSFEEEIRDRWAQFQAHRSRRRSLKPMPKFPTEDELLAAENQRLANEIAAQPDSYQPWLIPRVHQTYFQRNPSIYMMMRPQMSSALMDSISRQPAQSNPPPEDEKNEGANS